MLTSSSRFSGRPSVCLLLVELFPSIFSTQEHPCAPGTVDRHYVETFIHSFNSYRDGRCAYS